MILKRKTKLELFDALKIEDKPFGVVDKQEWIMSFLNTVWDLKSMPSEDPRFKNAFSDIIQHTINNDDWSIDELFIERLKLIDDDEKYIRFIETIVHPKFRLNEDETIMFVLIINSYIEKDGFILAITEYDDDDYPIYTCQEKDKDFPVDLPPNKISFHVIKKPKGHSNIFASHIAPKIKPAFLLTFNWGWNDFDFKTKFTLHFYENDTSYHKIGGIKITDGISSDTGNILPDEFTILPDNYCSIGQSEDFYINLKNATGKYFESTLYALKDAVFFADISDKFENNEIFKTSLIRYDSVERLLRTAKHKMYGFDLSNLYSFKFNFNPIYSDNSIDIEFDFNTKKILPNRIYGIIGKNGVGKTRLITSLPVYISEKKDQLFSPRAPMFSKVIAVSHSMFDNFKKPRKTSVFNYIYCGLLNTNNELLTSRQKVLRFHNTWKRIKELKRMTKWRKILLNFINEDIINSFIIQKRPPTEEGLTVDIKGYNRIKPKLSSGQNIILFIISEIISHIRFDSLLLFDEPETHLHPNAISQLMNTIYELVEEFESYCIITTHSPLIIQELFSKNVYVMERDENYLSCRKIGVESFGENLTTLTEEVFGNKEVPKHYKKIIDSLAITEQNYLSIVQKLKTNNIPLSLNIRLYIKSKIKQ
jgi:energy-coupling factor transporter ATP-binding protein EcfA2